MPEIDWLPSGKGEFGMQRGAPWAQREIDWILEEYGLGRQGLTLVSLLIPGQEISVHTDHHENNCRARIHVPLLTNLECLFISDGDEWHMQVGRAYLIDPTMPHGVVNRGSTDRIHLIFNAHKEGNHGEIRSHA
jgi:hypothetical protein